MGPFDAAGSGDGMPPLGRERHLTTAEQRIMANALRRSLRIIPERLACSNAIEMPPVRYRKRWLHAAEGGMAAFAAFVFVCVVIYGYLVMFP